MNCKNCNKALTESQNYCDNCGAKILQNRLTPKVLVQQVNEEFFAWDNKFITTFKELFTKPELVIDGFISGVRKRYINVLTYYAFALTVLGFQMFLINNFFEDFLVSESNSMIKMLNSQSKTNNPFIGYLDVLNDYQGVMFSLLMPFIAIGTWVVYLDYKKYNYTEHLVINLYATAQTVFVSFVFYLLFAIFHFSDFFTSTLIISPLVVLYGAYVYQRLYKTSFLSALIRYIAAYIIYIIVFSIVMVIVTIVFLIYMHFNGKLNS